MCCREPGHRPLVASLACRGPGLANLPPSIRVRVGRILIQTIRPHLPYVPEIATHVAVDQNHRIDSLLAQQRKRRRRGRYPSGIKQWLNILHTEAICLNVRPVNAIQQIAANGLNHLGMTMSVNGKVTLGAVRAFCTA